jgi:hypothetical protein
MFFFLSAFLYNAGFLAQILLLRVSSGSHLASRESFWPFSTERAISVPKCGGSHLWMVVENLGLAPAFVGN